MAETVTIAGKTIPKNYVYIGGAVALGVVGYAWWTAGGAAPIEEGEELPAVDEFGDERITPNTIDTYDVAVDNRTGLKTNAEWSQFVRDDLSGRSGYDSGVVSAAVGKYLARKPLTSAEVSIIQQANAVAGEPPEGRPWMIIPEGPGPAAVAPGPVTGLKLVSATPTSVTVGWSATPGASGYELRRDGGGVARKTGTTHTSGGLKPNTSYRFGVRSINSANNFGPEAFVTVKTAGGSSGGTLPAPSGILAVGGGGGHFRVGWTPVPGATGYRVRREGSGSPNTWAKVGPKTPYWQSRVRGIRSAKRYTFRVQTLGPGGSFGGNRVSNAVSVKP